MDDVLVLGASSFIGRHLMARLTPGRVVGTYHTNPFPGGLAFDATSMALGTLIERPERFSHAVILLSDTNPDRCARDPQRAHRLNVDSICRIVDQLDVWGVVPVFLSSEAVFDGRTGGYTERSPPAPLMAYGRHKVEVETYLMGRDGGSYLVARLARVVGSRRGDGTLFSAWLDQIEAGQSIRCASDHIFSPVHVDDVVDGLIGLMRRGLQGLYHVGGPEGIGRLAMLQRLLDQYRAAGHDYSGQVVGCRMRDFATLEPRPQDISLDSSSLIRQIDWKARSIDEICRALVQAV